MSNDGLGVAGAFFLGQQMAGKSGDMALAEAERLVGDAKLNAVLKVASEAQQEVKTWRIYANRLNVNLAARKMSEQTLLTELKKANIEHPMATEEGFEALFQEMLAEQYAIGDRAIAADERTPFDQKSIDEVGGTRMDVK